MFEGVAGDNPANRRLPVGNLINRVIGCLLFLPFLDRIVSMLGMIETDPVRLAADFHTLFNIVMALLFILPLNWLAGILKQILPDRKSVIDPLSTALSG